MEKKEKSVKTKIF